MDSEHDKSTVQNRLHNQALTNLSRSIVIKDLMKTP